MDKWQEDLCDSSLAINSIKNTIENMLDAQIISLENKNNEIAQILDVYAGIDYLVKTDNGLKGMATRVQYRNAYNSFTVRLHRTTGTKTEQEKRINNINNNYIYPYYTLQAYFENKNNLNLLSLAIINTEQLYNEILNNSKVVIRNNNKDNNKFNVIFWKDIKTQGFFKILESHQFKLF